MFFHFISWMFMEMWYMIVDSIKTILYRIGILK